MKTDNFTIREQANGGHDGAYYVTQNKKEHRNLGNPNHIRAHIPDGQRAFNRNSRVKFGFETQQTKYTPQVAHQPLELRPTTVEPERKASPQKDSNYGPIKYVN